MLSVKESESALNSKPLPEKLIAPRLVVRKARRRLELYEGGALLRVFPIALGRNPDVDKVREGDGATPLGTFFICTHNPESRFHRFLGISYPSAEDAARGWQDGLISREQARRILDALEHGRRPDWKTPLGGEIGIHGGGVGRDWTQGCIALSDEHVEELYDAVPDGTPVTIEP